MERKCFSFELVHFVLVLKSCECKTVFFVLLKSITNQYFPSDIVHVIFHDLSPSRKLRVTLFIGSL